jgi:hypothetical protein
MERLCVTPDYMGHLPIISVKEDNIIIGKLSQRDIITDIKERVEGKPLRVKKKPTRRGGKKNKK